MSEVDVNKDLSEVDVNKDLSEVDVNKDWYVIHTYSGFEQKVKTSLEEQFERSSSKEALGKSLFLWRTLLRFVKGKRRFLRESFSLGIF